VGCGNLHYDRLLQVPLSSMDQKTDQIGQQTARLLLKLIDAKAVSKLRSKSIVLKPELVRRRSTERAICRHTQ
jgi:LacI family transcriptional regulator